MCRKITRFFLFVFKDRLVFFNYLCEKDLLLQFSGLKIHTIHNPIVLDQITSVNNKLFARPCNLYMDERAVVL